MEETEMKLRGAHSGVETELGEDSQGRLPGGVWGQD